MVELFAEAALFFATVPLGAFLTDTVWTLLFATVSLNFVAVYLRYRPRRRYRW